jgi:hypothetical protein
VEKTPLINCSEEGQDQTNTKTMKLNYFVGKDLKEVNLPRNYALKLTGTFTKGDLALSMPYHKWISYEDMGSPVNHSVEACALVITPMPKKQSLFKFTLWGLVYLVSGFGYSKF